jgi:hypothetical protein
MTLSRYLATAVSFLAITLNANATLFLAAISTRTYSINGRGEIILHPGGQRAIIDLAAQNAGADAKSLVCVYDTTADALEVVHRNDGSLVSTIMTFSNGTDIVTAGATREYRQAFITLSDTNAISGSVDGPVHIAYDGSSNITAYHWDADFQYSIPGNSNTLNRIVHGHFVLGHEIADKTAP